jgi:pyruvate/2-oxoglutarate/acetoin dehydrogenase E1 component
MLAYDKKILQAQKEVKIVKKRLDVLIVEESISPTKKDMLIEQAEDELESAQKILEAEKSDEFEQLNKEVERSRA